jgi:hypothetical protein
MAETVTPFSEVYKTFFSIITDDMYMEITQEETEKSLFEYLEAAIQLFEFPRQDLDDYDEELQSFNICLTKEEINVLANYMVIPWIDQQLATCDLIRMQYSGSDFKMTSQANHISKLQTLKENYKTQAFHLQRLYKRRKKDTKGIQRSTFGEIMKMRPLYKTRGRF